MRNSSNRVDKLYCFAMVWPGLTLIQADLLLSSWPAICLSLADVKGIDCLINKFGLKVAFWHAQWVAQRVAPQSGKKGSKRAKKSPKQAKKGPKWAKKGSKQAKKRAPKWQIVAPQMNKEWPHSSNHCLPSHICGAFLTHLTSAPT